MLTRYVSIIGGLLASKEKAKINLLNYRGINTEVDGNNEVLYFSNTKFDTIPFVETTQRQEHGDVPFQTNCSHICSNKSIETVLSLKLGDWGLSIIDLFSLTCVVPTRSLNNEIRFH